MWDVIFLGEREVRVATCSEDGTIKIWDLEKGVCTVTLRGHSSDIWCLTAAALPSIKSAALRDGTDMQEDCRGEENLVLFSGGNDGSVKTWPVNAHSIAAIHTNQLRRARRHNGLSNANFSCRG